VSDPDGILATPLRTIARDLRPRGVPSDYVELAALVAETGAVEVIVGLPIDLAGREGPAAAKVRRYVRGLSRYLAPIPVLVTDERMSTAAATRRLSEHGVRGKRRRAVVDQAAAVEILQGWLDGVRRQRDA